VVQKESIIIIIIIIILIHVVHLQNISLIVVIGQRRYFFHIELPSVQLQRRFEKFLANATDDDKVY